LVEQRLDKDGEMTVKDDQRSWI